MQTENKRHYISKVEPGSIASEMGVEKGDYLLSINGEKIVDILDYMSLISQEKLEVLIQKGNGAQWILDIEKDIDDDLGLSFDPPTMDRHRSCYNKCIFCFIDQLPPHVRPTMCFKDDDWRLSFLMGNYITLTNLSEEDIERITNLRISPLYVSVHTTNPELRRRMMNNKKAGEVLNILDRFQKAGIMINCQIVLCPGWNDGKELERTLNDLWERRDLVQSVAAVPVGLTKYREGLAPLRPFSKEEANCVLDQIDKWQKRCKMEGGRTFIFPADEFFILADRPIPPYEYYEDFPQLDNGVGLISKFRAQFEMAIESMDEENMSDREVSIATGVSAYNFINSLAHVIGERFGVKVHVYAIPNRFFGNTVTVAGLVVGGDIIDYLKDKQLGSKLFIPEVMLRYGERVFLDDSTVEDVERALDIPVGIIPIDGGAFLHAIIHG